MGFAGFTINQTLAKQIKSFFALAPVTTVKYIKGLFEWMSEFLVKDAIEVSCANIHHTIKYNKQFLPIVCIRFSGILIRLICIHIMQWFFKHFGTGEFFPSYEILKIVSQNLCTPDMKIIDGICEDVLFLICGFDRGDTNIVSLIMPCV